jgi:hypothetical protein
MAGTITATAKARKGQGIVRIKAAFTVDASGDATATVIGSAFGRIVGVAYDPTAGAGATTDTNADLTITDADSGAALVTLTNAGTTARYFRPTAVVTDNAGTAITAAATAVDVNRDIFVAGNIKLTVAQGGNATTGSISVIVQEG